jgi:hypothetical protein
MEHDPGSAVDPVAASSMPDLQPPPPPSDPAEPDEPAQPEASPIAEDQPGPASRHDLTATGEPRVDAALRRLGELEELPVAEHPGVYERVHEQLVEVLGELHSGGQGR